MSISPEQVRAVDMSPSEGDFSVKLAGLENIPRIDGPATESSASTPVVETPSSDVETSSVSDKHGHDTASRSTASVSEDDKSNTSVEEGEIVDEPLDVVDKIAADAKFVVNTDKEVDEKAEVVAKADVEEEELKGESDDKINEDQVIATAIEDTADIKIDGDELLTLETLTHSSVTAPAPAEVIETISAPLVTDTPRSTQEATKSSTLASGTEDDVAVTDGEGTVAVAAQPPQPPQSARSVPPHLRTDLQLPATSSSGPRVAQHSAPLPVRYADFPRTPRPQFAPGFNYNNQNYGGNGDELARMRAHNMKLRNELGLERKKFVEMRQTVGLEIEKAMDDALSVMSTELLNKQAKLLARQFRVEAKARDLQYRQARIDQLEVYLTEGQKQVYRYLQGEIDRPTMADIDREHDRRQAELKTQKNIADREAQIAHRLQDIQLRETAQQMREQQYKALIRVNLEAGLRGSAIAYTDTKLEEFGELEYRRGLEAGMIAGRAEGGEDASRKGFLDGYDACQRAQIALSKVRQGLIAPNSPDLDFLYDAAHPHNLFSMGARVGIKETTASVAWTQRKEMQVGKEKAVQEKIEEKAEGKIEEPVRKAVLPARSTFASELRGAKNMHNGQFVLANGSGANSGAKEEGRPIIKYEDDNEVNLIDLY